MKTTLTITSKGQITLRKAALKALGVLPGDQVTVEVVAPGRLEMRPAERKGSIEAFIGSLAKPDTPVLSVEEMNRAIQDAWAGKK
jgi:bifunctional DNA-binding transcriptional regulator/antitoxin component of YhaV-PrlF toxin-antitoxin module